MPITEYRVHWKNGSHNEDLWLPLSELNDAKETVADYKKRASTTTQPTIKSKR